MRSRAGAGADRTHASGLSASCAGTGGTGTRGIGTGRPDADRTSTRGTGAGRIGTGGHIRPWPARLLHVYPPGWRDRYGDELEWLICDLRAGGRRPVPMAADLLRGAAAAWLTERREHMSERSRGALLTVLWSWVAFAAIAAWFGRDLGEYPSVSAYRQMSRALPAVPVSYHVLVSAGMVGLAATGAAAIAFAIGAVRDARANRRPRTYALMAVPPVTAAVWIGGLRLVFTQLSGSAVAVVGVLWLLAGVAGIAAATVAVSKIIRSCAFPALTWRIGTACAMAVTTAMVVATGATLAWGLAIRAGWAPTHHGTDALGWLTVTAIMAVTTVRAVIALLGLRRPGRASPSSPAAPPAAAAPPTAATA